jgi:hypothetical protein
MRILESFRKEKGMDATPIEQLPPAVLDVMLSQFFMALRKEDGTEYEPTSLDAVQASLMRYLRSKKYPHNIKQDPAFAGHRDVILAKRKFIT